MGTFSLTQLVTEAVFAVPPVTARTAPLKLAVESGFHSLVALLTRKEREESINTRALAEAQTLRFILESLWQTHPGVPATERSRQTSARLGPGATSWGQEWAEAKSSKRNLRLQAAEAALGRYTRRCCKSLPVQRAD